MIVSMRRTLLGLFVLALSPAATAAHVGSPDVIFEGKAGAYDVRVIVRTPMVVPGLAEVNVRILHGDVRRVLIRPVFWRAGVAGAPSPDAAKLVPGTRDLFSGQLWLMARGAYSVYVTVEGASGVGTASVPVLSVATGRLGMTPGLGILLLALGVVLIAGLVTIVYAAAGESLVEPGRVTDGARKRRARVLAVVAVPVLTIAVLGGARWWKSVDTTYQSRMYRPLTVRDTVLFMDSVWKLYVMPIDSSGLRTSINPLMPDHGKLMHLFLVDSAHATSFAHLHPIPEIGGFATPVPPLPPGTYRLFADITFETGQAMTLSGYGRLTRDDSARAPRAAHRDSDDAWTSSGAVERHGALSVVDTLEDQSTMEWLADSSVIKPGKEATLRFRVRDQNDTIAVLEPYLGMTAHAVIMRSDGSVFVHLHPAGTISFAAQRAFALRDQGDTTSNGRLRVPSDESAQHAMPMPGEFTIPYIFPRPGSYHIWVQVRRGGRVLTGVFDLVV